MKYILIIAFLFCQSCLLFGSDDSDPQTKTESDAGADVTKKDVPTIEDTSKPEDLSIFDTQIEDLSTDPDDCECDNNMVCMDGVCVCEQGFELVLDECRVGEVVKAVVRIPALLNNGNMVTEVDSGLSNFDQVVPFLSARSQETSARDAHILPKIIKNKIGFSRTGREGDVTINANLVEFDEQHVDVFSGTHDFAAELTVTEVMRTDGKTIDPTKAFLVFYAIPLTENDSIEYTPKNTSIQGTLTPLGIKFVRSESTGGFRIRWYVAVSKGSAFHVAHENTKIIAGRANSSIFDENNANVMVLWSNLSHVAPFGEGHVRCQYATIASNQSVLCSRGIRNQMETTDPIDISLQKIHFSNPNFSVQHDEVLVEREVRRNLAGGDDPKQTAISGQLGSAGITTLSAGEDVTVPGHPAMCTIEMTKFSVDGKIEDRIELRRESEDQSAVVSVQFIQWH